MSNVLPESGKKLNVIIIIIKKNPLIFIFIATPKSFWHLPNNCQIVWLKRGDKFPTRRISDACENWLNVTTFYWLGNGSWTSKHHSKYLASWFRRLPGFLFNCKLITSKIVNIRKQYFSTIASRYIVCFSRNIFTADFSKKL